MTRADRRAPARTGAMPAWREVGSQTIVSSRRGVWSSITSSCAWVIPRRSISGTKRPGDMATARPAVAVHPCLPADIMAQHGPVAIAARDQPADDPDPPATIGQAHVRKTVATGHLPAEEVELQHAAGLGQPLDAAEIEVRPLHVVRDHPRGIGAMGDRMAELLRRDQPGDGLAPAALRGAVGIGHRCPLRCQGLRRDPVATVAG